MFIFIMLALITTTIHLTTQASLDLSENYHLNRKYLLQSQNAAVHSALSLQYTLNPLNPPVGNSTQQRLQALDPLPKFLTSTQAKTPSFSLSQNPSVGPLQSSVLLLPASPSTPPASSTTLETNDNNLSRAFTGLTCPGQPSATETCSLSPSYNAFTLSNASSIAQINATHDTLLQHLTAKLLAHFRAGTPPPSSSSWISLWHTSSPASQASASCKDSFSWPANSSSPIQLLCSELGAYSWSSSDNRNSYPYTYKYVYYKKTGPNIADFTLALRD